MITHRSWRLSAVAAVVSILCSAGMLHAQWVRCGPQGGAVTSLAVLGSRILAGTVGNYYNQTPGSGVFVSIDSGLTWSESNEGLTDTTIYALGVSGSYIVASTASGNVFRSSDSGASWQSLPSVPISQPITSFLPVSNYLFAVTGADGVLRSTDHGASWWRNRKAPMDIHTIVAMDTILFANGSWLDTGAVYRSTDYGVTWTEVYSSAFDIATAGNYLVAAMYHTVSNAMSYSTDQGVTWESTGYGSCGVYDQLAAAGPIMFVNQSQDGVFYSLDSGVNWNSANGIRDFYCVAAMGKVILVGNDVGVLRSTDTGNSWNPTIAGMYMFSPGITYGPYCFTSFGHTLIAGNMNYLNGVRSTDGGTHWTIDTFAADNEIMDFASMGSVLLASSNGNMIDGTATRGLYRSDDGGIGWKEILPDSAFSNFLVKGPELFAFSWYSGILRSMDTGRTWASASQGLDPGPYGFGQGPIPLTQSGSDLYAAPTGYGSSNDVYRSTNDGITWRNLTHGIISEDITGISANGPDICVSAGGNNYYRDGSGRMYLSTDGGASWSSSVADFRVNTFLRSATNILAATQQGMYLSQDNGASWEPAMNGMSPDTNAVYSLGMIDSTIYASTANGIWKQQRSQIPFMAQPAAVKNAAETPSISITPNPTSGLVTIQGSAENIVVTNVLGVPVLSATSPQSTQASLDLSRLPAGTYFVRMETANRLVVKTVVKE